MDLKFRWIIAGLMLLAMVALNDSLPAQEDQDEDLSLWGDLANAASADKVAADKRDEGSSIRAKLGVKGADKNVLSVKVLEIAKRQYPFAKAKVRVEEIVTPGRKVDNLKPNDEMELTLVVDAQSEEGKVLFDQVAMEKSIVGKLATKEKEDVVKYGLFVLEVKDGQAVNPTPSEGEKPASDTQNTQPVQPEQPAQPSQPPADPAPSNEKKP